MLYWERCWVYYEATAFFPQCCLISKLEGSVCVCLFCEKLPLNIAPLQSKELPYSLFQRWQTYCACDRNSTWFPYQCWNAAGGNVALCLCSRRNQQNGYKVLQDVLRSEKNSRAFFLVNERRSVVQCSCEEQLQWNGMVHIIKMFCQCCDWLTRLVVRDGSFAASEGEVLGLQDWLIHDMKAQLISTTCSNPEKFHRLGWLWQKTLLKTQNQLH